MYFDPVSPTPFILTHINYVTLLIVFVIRAKIDPFGVKTLNCQSNKKKTKTFWTVYLLMPSAATWSIIMGAYNCSYSLAHWQPEKDLPQQPLAAKC